MTPSDLKIGSLYRLTQEVKNPLCDRRSADTLKKLSVFPKGMLFVCFVPMDAPSLRELHTTDLGLSGNNSCPGFTAAIHREGEVVASKYEWDQKWAGAIVPHLEEAAVDSWALMCKAYGRHSQLRVLRDLVEDGTVSLERVVELMRLHTIGASEE